RANELLFVYHDDLGVMALDLPALGGGQAPRGAATTLATLATGGALQLSPNPFRGDVTFRFETSRASHARLDVFDLAGRRVTTLVDRRLVAGPQTLTWSGRDRTGAAVAPGVYFVRLTRDGSSETERIVRLR
ncbi:MAG: T9SS type A sorting domain-containing protein, partial [Gemmatimonadetes bacterium]|nr:T9SS type A sorting domain-containing protein [Gemmatimonadota bacterium]